MAWDHCSSSSASSTEEAVRHSQKPSHSHIRTSDRSFTYLKVHLMLSKEK